MFHFINILEYHKFSELKEPLKVNLEILNLEVRK